MRMEGCPGMGSVPGTQHQPWLEGERVRGTEVLLHPAWGSLSSWAAGFDPQPPLPPLPLSPGALLLNKRVSLQWLVCTEKGLFGGGGGNRQMNASARGKARWLCLSASALSVAFFSWKPRDGEK